MTLAGKNECGRRAFFLGGITLYALGLNLFLAPNNIAAGGVSGIATVLGSLLPVSVATVIFLINLPLLVASVFVRGWKFTKNTLVGSWVYTGLVYATAWLPVLTTNPVCAALFGGALYGAGMALLVLGNGSVGGTDLVIRLLVARFPSISVGKMALLVESGVIAFSMIAYRDIEVGLYAILAIYICAVFADKALRGFNQGNLCFIITGKDPGLVAAPLMEHIGCAVTRLDGYGMYSAAERGILLTAIRTSQTPRLKRLLSEVDAKAFVVVLPATEILGGKFQHLFLPGEKP
ncbi:YitT family protein [Desulfovibrio aminophilus]|nr:YitT family protein [Desulfovibrio aminophilus]MCM0755326.1 YitT family protein [Desulfovibrio aminophilus]